MLVCLIVLSFSSCGGCREIFFTRNGRALGVFAHDVKPLPYRACVQWNTAKGNAVTLNFGVGHDRKEIWGDSKTQKKFAYAPMANSVLHSSQSLGKTSDPTDPNTIEIKSGTSVVVTGNGWMLSDKSLHSLVRRNATVCFCLSYFVVL